VPPTPGTEIARRIVLVSGAPGSGKTAVAVPLAGVLGFPLLSKDDIKETLWEALEPEPDDVEWSRKLGGAAMEVMWALAARCPCAILDAPFRPRSAVEREHLVRLDARIVEVHCACPPEVAIGRYNRRAQHRHPTHVIRELTPKHLAEFEGTLGVGPVIEVDTKEVVDVPALAQRVRELLA
jgi:predicted kinase